MLARIGLVIAALTPRRGFGVAADHRRADRCSAASQAIVAGDRRGVRATDTLAGYAGLLSPFTLVDGVQVSLLGRRGRRSPDAARRTAGGAVFALAALVAGRRPATLPAAAPLPEGVRLVSTITLDHVSRWFGNVVAVNDVTMTIGPGVTGLLGPNGAGKSTLIHMMGGFLAPSTGTVDARRRARSGATRTIYRHIGLVPEREAMYDVVTGWEFVLANAKLHGLADPEAAPSGRSRRST